MNYFFNNRKVSIINIITLWVVFGLLILNYGFQMIRIPPSGIGLPLAEVMLVLVLFKSNIVVLLKKLRTVINVHIFILFFLYGVIRVFLNYFDYGILAIRDGLPIFESIYILVGFHLAGNIQTANKIYKYMLFTFIFIGFYILMYPFSIELKQISPSLASSQGNPVPIAFNYINTTLVVLMAAAWSIEKYHLDGNKSRYIIYSSILIITILILFPSRTLFLMLIVFGFLVSMRGSAISLLKTFPFYFGAAILFIFLVSSGINIQSRFGDVLSLDSYIQLFTEILFDSEENISSGMEGRVIWWESIITRVTDSFSSFLFGLGYGMPLIDFHGSGGVVVREPHNTLIGVFGRGGLIGLILFILLQLQILKVVYYAIKSAKKKQYSGHQMILPIIMLLLGTLVNSLGESPFVMPFYAVPYYFFAGCLMRYSYMRKNHNRYVS